MIPYHFDHHISIVVPTKGRPTLERCLQSMMPKNQGGYGAIRYVVYDSFGPTPDGYLSRAQIKMLCEKYGAEFLEYNAGYNDWGYHQLEYGYSQCNWTEYIMNIGDDDILVENVLIPMTKIMNHNGLHPYMFQALLHPSAHRGNTAPVTLWNDSDRSLARQTITGQNLVAPNIPKLWGHMADDCEFIQQTIANWKGLVMWVPLTIVECY